jgi:hypothetical protein
MNNMQRIFCAVLTVWAGFLTYKVVELEKQVNMYGSMSTDIYRQANGNSLTIDSIMQQIPAEVEIISRKIAKEQVIKAMKTLQENINKIEAPKLGN